MQFLSQVNNQNKIMFNNGVILSVQAGPLYYSIPREDCQFNLYTHYEIGLINASITDLDFLADYMDSSDDGLTVYVYVPVEEVEKLFHELVQKYGIQPVVLEEVKNKKEQAQTVTLKQTIKQKIKQKAIITAMNMTKDENLYDYLGDELQKTLRFVENEENE